MSWTPHQDERRPRTAAIEPEPQSRPAEPAAQVIRIDLGDLAQRVAALVVAAIDDTRAPRRSPWLTVDGAAAHLSCSPERLRKLVQRRAIPFHQECTGGRLFFHQRELDEWLLNQ